MYQPRLQGLWHIKEWGGRDADFSKCRTDRDIEVKSGAVAQDIILNHGNQQGVFLPASSVKSDLLPP